MRLSAVCRLPLLLSCVTETPAPSTPPPTTETGETIITGGTQVFGDEGHVMLTRRAVGPEAPPVTELFGLFVDDARGTYNLSRCAVTGELCLETVPPDEDDYIEIAGGTEFQPSNYSYRYVGTSFQLNDKQAWYVGTAGINYYYSDLTNDIGFSNISGDHDLVLDGVWGQYLGDNSIYISPMLNVLSHEPGSESRFHDGENIVIEWEPDGRGDIYLTVNGPLTLSRMYLLEDDGYFELPVDSLNLGTDPADLNFSLSRWNWGEANANGNYVSIASVSTVDWSGEYFYVGGRDMLVAADRCLEAGAMTPLQTGLYWGRLQDWGYNDDLDVSEGADCTNGDTDAQEGFIRVELPGHSFVSATFQLLEEDAALYVVRDCDNANSCILGEDQGIEGEPESLQYFNNTDFDEEVYLGLDSAVTTNGVYYLDVMWKHGRDTPDIPEWLFGVHMLAKVELERDRARYTFIDIEKLDRLGSTGLRVVEVGDKSGYDEEDGLLITSSTRKLQQFLEEHGKTADIWANYPEDDPGWLPRQ